jgi:hypothetical protein
MKNAIRNTKAIVAGELALPPRNVNVRYLDGMSKDESDLYKHVYGRVSKHFEVLIRSDLVMKRYATVMSWLALIRQAAEHPANLPLTQYGG